MPLYGVLTEGERLGGIAFALLRAGKGMALEALSGPGVLNKRTLKDGETMRGRVATWRGVLEALACEFAEGSAHVAPKEFPKTCKHCGQRLICRLNTTTLRFKDSSEDDSHGYGEDSSDG